MCGGQVQDKRSVTTCIGTKLQCLKCNSSVVSTDFMAKLGTIRGEFKALEDAKAEETKRADLLFRIKETLPTVECFGRSQKREAGGQGPRLPEL